MYYICAPAGHIITSRPTKEEADLVVQGTNLTVRPSYETLQLEKARHEATGETSPDDSHNNYLIELAEAMRSDYDNLTAMAVLL